MTQLVKLPLEMLVSHTGNGLCPTCSTFCSSPCKAPSKAAKDDLILLFPSEARATGTFLLLLQSRSHCSFSLFHELWSLETHSGAEMVNVPLAGGERGGKGPQANMVCPWSMSVVSCMPLWRDNVPELNICQKTGSRNPSMILGRW